jgi:predicted acyl esterase
MQRWKGVAAAGTAVLATAVALTGPAKAAPAAAPVPDVQPTFVNGLAQPVFSGNSADWVRGQVWVQTDFDSDGDGKPDRMHAEYSVPGEAVAEGLKVPAIYEDSPYFAGTARSYSNWVVDHELGTRPDSRPFAPFWTAKDTVAQGISGDFNNPWVSRGFAVVHSESPGTGASDGCPSSGGRNETLGATAIVDWLAGRRAAYTSRTGDVQAPAPAWSSGHVGMMGTSYNGTIPEAAATTGVQGLDAIVPISAISDWYDYYRANGMVRAPHSRAGGNGNNSFLGEDLDVLEDDVYSRLDETSDRLICRPQILDTAQKEDRSTGDRNAFWDERDYMKDVQNVHAAALLAHGNNDFNVMTKNAAQFYDALKRQGVPHMFYFHQGGHGGAPPDVLVNLWFSHFLYGVDNNVQNMPHSWVVREANACPPRQSTVTGDQSNTTTLAVADSSPFQLGFRPTVPVTNADGTVTNASPTPTIADIPDATHITLAAPVATGAGQKVAGGTVVSLACSTSNPTPYSEWHDPASAPVTLHLLPGGATRGNLTMGAGGGSPETLTDDASVTSTTALDAATSPQRLIYQSPVLTQDVRLSGTPTVSLSAAFSKPRANLSVYLVSLPADGSAGTILTRGWKDPTNRDSDYTTELLTPGTFYRLDVDLQPKDAIVKAGNRLGLMVMSSDHDYTIRPAPGTQVTVDPAATTMTLPVVGGAPAFAQDTGTGYAEGGVSGTVPATLALTLGAPASFGPFTPGVERTYTASTTADVVSTAGDAALSVSDPGHLANGAFTLPQPLQVDIAPASWTQPVSHATPAITFTQKIGANDPLRTGTYSRTLTFTLSTTNP